MAIRSQFVTLYKLEITICDIKLAFLTEKHHCTDLIHIFAYSTEIRYECISFSIWKSHFATSIYI